MKGQSGPNSSAPRSPHSPPPTCPQLGHQCLHTCSSNHAHMYARTHRLRAQQQTPAHPHLLPPRLEPQAHSSTGTGTCTQPLHHAPCTSMHTYVTQVHSDTHSPPRTLWHTRTCHLLADLRAACTHTRMHTHKYSLAGSLHPLEQRPISGHLVHSHIPPQGDSLHTMLHTGPHHPLALQPLVRTLPETAAGS